MFFVGNPGCIEIYTGPITNVKTLGEWVNVLDPAVNLHVDTAAIVSAWAVEKPSPDGPVSSLEFLDADGAVILQMFGKRKPGEPELEAWTQVAASV
jgi:putative hemin transport protein